MAKEDESILMKEGYFIVLALILAFGILQFSGTLLGTDRPVVSVVSCSMYPEYDRGDVLGVNGAEFDDLQEGDVIVFQVPMTVELELNNNRYTVGEENTNTPLGRSKVVTVDDNIAVIEIDGERLQVRNGGSYTVKGEQITIRDVSGMDIPVVHRIVSKGPDSLETKGDNNPEQLDFEKDIRPEQIHGKVFFRIPKIGAIKLIAMDLTGLTGQPFILDNYSPCN